jgi:hypothetical protein
MEPASEKTLMSNAETEKQQEATSGLRGSMCKSKDLYRGFDDNHNLIWTDDLDETTATDETENLKFAVLAYHDSQEGIGTA